MRIDGITSCVGELFRGYLQNSLHIWLNNLDSLTIVTDSQGCSLEAHPKLRIIQTDVFTENKAYFNKGAALNQALAVAIPTDWILSFDADIIPPKAWRTMVESRAKKNYINGSHRYSETGTRLDPVQLLPKGYFQLWHVSDPHYRTYPIFNEWHTYAGCYDTHFYNQWPHNRFHNLRMRLIHQGKKSTHWFGVGADPKLMVEALGDKTKRKRIK